MTTALSPDSRMLIHMICSSATQNAAVPISLQPLASMPSQAEGSIICATEPTATSLLPVRERIFSIGPRKLDLIYKRNPAPGQRAKTLPARVLLSRRFHCPKKTDRFPVGLADRAGGRLGRIGRAHHLAIFCDGVFAFEHLHDHRSRNHEFDELAKERPFAVHCVEGFRLLAADARALLRDDAQACPFDHVVDRAG